MWCTVPFCAERPLLYYIKVDSCGVLSRFVLYGLYVYNCKLAPAG